MILRIDGLTALDNLLKNMPAEAISSAKKALKIIAEDLKGESTRRAPKAPMHGGALRRSAFEEVEEHGDKLEATVGFKEPYATKQHEHIEYSHTDGEAKFLETPYKERQDMYVADLGKAIAKAVTK